LIVGSLALAVLSGAMALIQRRRVRRARGNEFDDETA
jgi:hypothetical protein